MFIQPPTNRRRLRSTLFVGGATLVLAGVIIFSGVVAASEAAEDSTGITLELGIVAPTSTPQPTIDVPVDIPVDVPVSEAVFEIKLSGLQPFSYIEIYANSTPVLIASGFADGNGVFSAQVQLPPNIPPGEHTISAVSTLADGTRITTTVVAFAVTQFGTLGESGSASGGSDGAVGGSGTSGGVGKGTSATIETQTLGGSAANGYLGPDPFNLGGVFYLGDLAASARDGRSGIYDPVARLEFAVRNVSKDRVPAIAHLWVTGPLGNVVADVPRYQLVALESGETRLVIATLPGIGQWGGYTAHMVFTPPTSTNGGDPIQFRRDAPFFAFSAVIVGIFLALLLTVLTYLVGRRYRGWRLNTMFATTRRTDESLKAGGRS